MGPGKVTLDALISTVRRRADLVNSAFLSDAEITDFLRASAGELWDALVTAYSGYAEASKVYTTDGTNALPCPANMLKADGLDLEISEVNSVRITLKRIAWSDRNKYRWPLSTPWPTHYALRGDNIYLFPTPAAGKSITLWYVPRMTPLSNSGTAQVLPEFRAGDGLTVNGTAFVANAYEWGTRVTVGFTSVLPGVYISNGISFLDSSGTTWSTIENKTTTLVAEWQAETEYVVGDLVRKPMAPVGEYILKCTTDGTSGLTFPTTTALGDTPTDGTTAWRTVGMWSAGAVAYTEVLCYTPSNTPAAIGRFHRLATTEIPDIKSCYNDTASLPYVSPADVLSGKISTAAANPVSALYGLSSAASNNVITLTCLRPTKVALTAISPTIYAQMDEWISYLDGFDGWEELLILDTVIKCKLKDEQDVTPEVALKDRLQQRIRDAAANRDQGGPGVVSEIWDPYEMNVGLGPYYSRWGW